MVHMTWSIWYGLQFKISYNFSPLSPPISSESSEYLAANEANLSRDMFGFVFVGVRGTVPDSTSRNPIRPLSSNGFRIQAIRERFFNQSEIRNSKTVLNPNQLHVPEIVEFLNDASPSKHQETKKLCYLSDLNSWLFNPKISYLIRFELGTLESKLCNQDEIPKVLKLT